MQRDISLTYYRGGKLAFPHWKVNPKWQSGRVTTGLTWPPYNTYPSFIWHAMWPEYPQFGLIQFQTNPNVNIQTSEVCVFKVSQETGVFIPLKWWQLNPSQAVQRKNSLWCWIGDALASLMSLYWFLILIRLRWVFKTWSCSRIPERPSHCSENWTLCFFSPLSPSCQSHHSYETHCNLLQSLLQLPQSPSALLQPLSVVTAPVLHVC